ncbi:SWIM zinc finger family protein [Nocardia terpenica]|uniref:SWIM zinc finger family protein n=1 Tax=Nocardia terpenica TaxID=455432 RepID=UPI002B4B71FF|nr:SWIM zinc finger family protein [Nocardia terpenica]
MTTSQAGVRTAVWTAEQVAALAPDAASLAAARKLHGRWSGTGRHAEALWGLCRGSGAKPYQTIVDLDGPAYKCTCPSRKFPCKHALALLLAWSEGMVPEAAGLADFAADWIGTRRARAAKPDPAPRGAKATTREQRHGRVSAGLADLDVWLGDQVRTGLAQADRSFVAFEAVAARMVDAQAPGVAAALRQLPRTVATREDWPALLLRDYARLHLLAAAHRRLDELEPALAASVRTHIGYPTAAEAVREQPPVRDRWMVLGHRITDEERLYTRRVWLRGRDCGRWAVIVDHSFGAPSFPGDMPVPGAMVEADLHFYPGAAPLRALWGARYDVPTPFTTVPVSAASPTGTDATHTDTGAPIPGSIAAALTDHARALGADPWLRAWPMLLAEVVPVVAEDRWYVRELNGTALPLVRLADPPWRLFGLSGGHPLTVLGEWTADGLVPISAHAGGNITQIVSEPVGAATTAATTELTAAALLGTARRAPSPDRLPGPVAAAAARLTGDPAFVLLETAALAETFERGGLATTVAPPVAPAADDDRPPLPAAAATRLARLLEQGSPFLPEWFEIAAPHGYRAPDALCSLLLEQAKTRAPLRDSLLDLAGTRGRWLAEHNPQWRNLLRARPDDPGVWSHGRPAERRDWLAALRERDPRAAYTTLSDGWRAESGSARAELLSVLADGLSGDDEPLLESALDDGRADVRRTAADLLARLPDSAFAARMRQRAEQWLLLRGDRLTAELPPALGAAARRDGVGDRFPSTAYHRDGAPDVDAERLRRVVAATPLSYWETHFATATGTFGVRMDDWMLGPVFTGLAEAALAQRDARWAQALFEMLTATPTLGADVDVRRELFALLPLGERVRYLRSLDSSWLAEVELLLPAVPRPWPGPLAEHLIRLLLDRARLAAARPGAPGLSPASYRTLFRTAAVHFPVSAVAAVSVAARRCGDAHWENAFDQLAHDLTQRTTMLEELQ